MSRLVTPVAPGTPWTISWIWIKIRSLIQGK